jgi:hypothetical protein
MREVGGSPGEGDGNGAKAGVGTMRQISSSLPFNGYRRALEKLEEKVSCR